MLWSKKSKPVHEKTRAVGIDLTSSRARAVAATAGIWRPLVLDAPAEDMVMFLALDRRMPEVGKAGYALCRKTPHAVCSNFLAAIGHTREWRCGRNTLTPDTALELAFQKLRDAVAAESEATVLALPSYMSPSQIGKMVASTAKAKFPIKGTAVGALALVADRAASLLTGKPVAPEVRRPTGSCRSARPQPAPARLWWWTPTNTHSRPRSSRSSATACAWSVRRPGRGSR